MNAKGQAWRHGELLLPVCAVPHCSNPVETCFKHACPSCGTPKSSKVQFCHSCSAAGGVSVRVNPASSPPPTPLPTPTVPERSLVRLHRKFETQHSVLFQVLFDGVSAIEKVPLSPENTPALLKEAELHALVDRHPNVIRNYGLCRRSSGEVTMVVEQLEGDLTERLNTIRDDADFRPEAWTTALALYIVQVGRGLRHLHRHGIVHRDICANNILTDGELMKVSDFGLAKRANDHSPTGLPYPLTTAPEVLRNMNDTSIWSTKADVWQYGLLLCEAFSFGINPLKEFNVSVSALMAALDRRWLPARPQLCPEALWHIIVMCLEQDHRVRPEMEVVVPLMETFASSLPTVS
eukprot:GGOE01020715.1.p1 GENE.GGOE01020715.1~~GGOE01020715.1.p1  ORF type:complete len:374 (-),score=97.28 GGOE01020715.1:294-1343(-)